MKPFTLALTIAVAYVVAGALSTLPSRIDSIVALAIVLGPAIVAGADRGTRPCLRAFVAVSLGIFVIEISIFLFPVGHMGELLPQVMPDRVVTSAVAAVVACMFGCIGGTGAYVIRLLRKRV